MQIEITAVFPDFEEWDAFKDGLTAFLSNRGFTCLGGAVEPSGREYLEANLRFDDDPEIKKILPQ